MTRFSVDREMRRAKAREREGALHEARQIYRSILEKFPNNSRAGQALSALESSGAQAASRQEARPATAGAPRPRPDDAEDYLRQGIALHRQGRVEEAIGCFRHAAKIRPDALEPQMFAGLLLKDAGRYDEAQQYFQNALRVKPDSFEACYGLGITLMHQHRGNEAIACFQRGLQINPRSTAALVSLGYVFADKGHHDQAIACYRQALSIDANSSQALVNLGSLLRLRGELGDALSVTKQAVLAGPGDSGALTQQLRLQAEMCDWEAFAEFERIGAELGIEGDAASPFSLLAFEDNPERQAQRARNFALQTYKQKALPLPTRPARHSGKLRVGYFSADFHDHATLYLMSGLLREHDRSRFEIFAYSYGTLRRDRMRDQLARDVDHLVDIHDRSDHDAVSMAREHGLDIAIDVKGYTQDTRSQLFAYRLAPVQINYLAYPGTMGADFMDYIVADRVVIPEAERQFYTEKIIYLPGSYQPNDNRREIAQTRTSRADFGLPAEGFVFCCFNANYKIGPREFDIWMRLLGKVEGSVLWLLRSNEWAEENLRREARSRGIAPDRLVFADKMAHGEHLARHKHADLFLDTFIYNAHTTASDALWAGVPVVTRAGRQFAARVGASLLTAAGLPELITESEEAYEALILGLASDAGRLAAVRSKLADNRLTRPLFDTVRYTRDFEKALEAVHQEQMAMSGVAAPL